MNGNKTVKVKKETSKVKEFVKKNGKYVFVGAMCGLTYSVGYLVCRHKYINNTFAKHLIGAVNGGDMYYCENSLGTDEINTVKGLTNLAKHMILDATRPNNATGVNITEDTKVTGVMVFMKKN